jgi:hypothetical protein
MRYRDFAANRQTTHEHRCNIATLHVLAHEWSDLRKIRQANGPTRIAAVRSLTPRFQGFSIDIVCSSRGSAIDLLVAWCKPSAAQPSRPKTGTSTARSGPKP